MSGSNSVSWNPSWAKRQLWGQLPGIYLCWRKHHHDLFIRGDEVLEPRNCTSADIKSASGETRIIPRRPKDEKYDKELLLKTIILLDTETNHRAFTTEHHVLRVQDGKWSYWEADAKGVVRRKIRDLVYNNNAVSPKFAATPWQETYGTNKYLSLDFSLGDKLGLTIVHRIEYENGRNTVEGTHYRMVCEFEKEGWLEWLTDEMKAVYRKWKASGGDSED